MKKYFYILLVVGMLFLTAETCSTGEQVDKPGGPWVPSPIVTEDGGLATQLLCDATQGAMCP